TGRSAGKPASAADPYRASQRGDVPGVVDRPDRQEYPALRKPVERERLLHAAGSRLSHPLQLVGAAEIPVRDPVPRPAHVVAPGPADHVVVPWRREGAGDSVTR